MQNDVKNYKGNLKKENLNKERSMTKNIDE